MAAGLLIMAAGLVIFLFHDKLHWIGRLPGDIRVEKENFRFYFPLTTMLLFSILVSIVLIVVKKFFW